MSELKKDGNGNLILTSAALNPALVQNQGQVFTDLSFRKARKSFGTL